jgi:peroxiredoxin
MPLLRPGDTFPDLPNRSRRAADPVPAVRLRVRVVLFNRGAVGPYCTAQLRAFQRAGDPRPRPASGWPRLGRR